MLSRARPCSAVLSCWAVISLSRSRLLGSALCLAAQPFSAARLSRAQLCSAVLMRYDFYDERGAHVAVAYSGSSGMVVSAAYHGGGINILKILADGSLGAPASILHKGEKEAHPHSCFIDPSGRYGLVSDLGLDRIYVYRLDVLGGALQEEQILETTTDAGPRHMSFHPNGKFVYGINELDSTINVYAFGKDGAILGPTLQTVSTLPDGYNNRDHVNAKNAKGDPASGPNRPPDQTNATADIHVSPDGRFLYGSNRGHDSLVCFSIGRDGLLTLVDFTSTEGAHPRNFSIHPSGSWVLVANQDAWPSWGVPAREAVDEGAWTSR
ncbi:unnamed protein product [Effrenium voratum]|uniref:6-phosphogluconolactonase n=1 Tax=Effrenium voratum TaxID=2562239 RepID=A0AA36J874_9DINO|nr:unnamed protein product [Effrenium voratum]